MAENTLPWHMEYIGTAFLSCCFINNILSPLISRGFFKIENPYMRFKWNLHLVGIIQTTFLSFAVVYVYVVDEQRKTRSSYHDRLYSYNEQLAKVNAYCLGYFAWELMTALWNMKLSNGMLIVHCMFALGLLSAAHVSRPFLNFYTYWGLFCLLSTPFSHIRWFSEVMGFSGTTFQLVNELALTMLFFWTRLACTSYQWAMLSYDLLASKSIPHPRYMGKERLIICHNQNWSAGHETQTAENARRTDLIHSGAIISFYLSLTGLAFLNLCWFPKLIKSLIHRFKLRKTQTSNQVSVESSQFNGLKISNESIKDVVHVESTRQQLWADPRPLFRIFDSNYAIKSFLVQKIIAWYTSLALHRMESLRVTSLITGPLRTRSLPSTETELKMQALWSSTLMIDASRIGSNDNFFQLGGDSMQAIKMVAMACDAGLEFTVANLFTCSTLSDLSSITKLVEKHQVHDPLPFEMLADDIILEKTVDEVASLCGVNRQQIEDVYPCTPLQEGIMMISITSNSYIARHVIELDHLVDFETLMTAWQYFTEVSSMFRTRIVHSQVSGGMLQVVIKELPAWTSDSNLEVYLNQDSKITMGFGEPLTRCAQIIDSKSSQQYLVVTLHHAIYDGWSLSLAAKRLAQIINGVIMPAPAKFNRFVEYVLHQNEKEATKEFWKTQLTGAQPSVFPASPNPKCQAKADSHYSYSFRALQTNDSIITMATTIQAAWGLLMAQYENSSSIVFGATVTGRNSPLPGLEDIIGPTIATIPLRLNISSSQSVSEYLQAVQDRIPTIIPFEHYGIQNIRALSSDTDLACEFQNLLIIHPTAWSNDLQGIGRIREEFFHLANDKTYPRVLECILVSEVIRVNASFDSNLVSERTVSRAIQQFESVILRMLCRETRTNIGDIQTISPADEAEILNWNRMLPETNQACIHELVTDKASALKDQQAICGWDASFTYQELESLSSQLASELIAVGVYPETLVPVIFEKSSWTIVAMLGVLKAGGASAALNPHQPISRIEDMIKELTATVILCSELQAPLFKRSGRIVVTVGRSHLLVKEVTTHQQPHRAQPHNTAFIVFTSGSTGTPKGVVLKHAAFCTSAQENGTAMGLGTSSRVLQFSSYTFDVSLGEIFFTLSHGGCVCIPSESERLNHLGESISRMRVNCAALTPSVANIIHPGKVLSLKTLVITGEAATQSIVEKWAENVNLIHAYGPAETIVWSTSYDGLERNSSPRNIGRGVGSRTWIVKSDNHDILVPIGCAGELLIEGPTLAHGYLNKPEKTKEFFIDEPNWSKGLGSNLRRRFYKTGDLARYNYDGTLQFVGRKDLQVKLRGQRIELGEIEHHLLSYENVLHAVVSLPSSGPYEKQLVGVISLRDMQQTPRGSDDGGELKFVSAPHLKLVLGATFLEIKRHLSDQLPEYMVPTQWIPVWIIPLVASGKLDRGRVSRWLNSLDPETEQDIQTLFAGDIQHHLPTTMTERLLTVVWSTVLNIPVERISTDQSFRGAGGDSISAMQVVTHCRGKGIRTSFIDVINCRSLAHLASICEATPMLLPTLPEEVVDIPFALSPIQKMHFQLAPHGENHFNQSALFSIAEPIQFSDLDLALETLVARHSMLRARFEQTERGEWVQRISGDIQESYILKQHLLLDIREMDTQISISQSGLNIKHGPLMRVNLFDMNGASRGRFLFLTIHHLVIDLVSWRILLHELEVLLRHRTLEGESPVPFQVWCGLQARHPREHLSPSSSWELCPEVPPPNYEYWGLNKKSYQNLVKDSLIASFKLDPQVTSHLLSSANDGLRTQPLDILISALVYSFKETFPDRPQPAVFNEGHGRESWDPVLDPSQTVGWFTTIIPIPVEWNSDEGIIQIIGQTKDTRHRIRECGSADSAFRSLHPKGKSNFEVNEPIEILFNYAGLSQQLEKEGSLFRQVERADFLDIGPTGQVNGHMQRHALFDIFALVQDERLCFYFTYNRYLDHQDGIRNWIKQFENSIIEAGKQLSAIGRQFTFSDFPLLHLTPQGLYTLVKEIFPNIGIESMYDIQEVYPCSPMQQDILLEQNRTPGNYEIRLTWEVEPSLAKSQVDCQRLEQAWQMVVNRHSTLRTFLINSASEGRTFDQVVAKTVIARTTILQPGLAAMNGQPLLNYKDLGLPHRLTICQTPSGSVTCMLEVSHAIIDGTSLQILKSELLNAYNGTLATEPALEYRDYIAYLGKRQGVQATEYWKNHLASLKPCYFPSLNDSIKNPRTLQTMDVKIEKACILHSICSVKGITVTSLMQAAWALVLQHYTATNDICFGLLVSGRDVSIKNIEKAVGLFINILVCRLDTSSQDKLTDAMRNMQEDFSNGLLHQHSSLKDIRNALNYSDQDLFNSILSVQVYPPRDNTNFGSISFKNFKGYEASEFDIWVNVRQFGEEIEVSFNYWTSCISDREAVDVARTFSTAIKHIVQNPYAILHKVKLFNGEG